MHDSDLLKLKFNVFILVLYLCSTSSTNANGVFSVVAQFKRCFHALMNRDPYGPCR